MTLTTTTQKLIYTGNGSLTEFSYTWLINTNTDLKVYLRTIATGAESLQTLTTHYSVSGVGSASGGNVTFVSAPADTLQIVIVRAVPLTQDTDYVENDSFGAEVHEGSLDTLMMAVQDQNEILARSIKLSPTNVMTSTEFTQSAADRASKVLAFDSSGELSVTQELGTFQGNWAASTAYSIRDLIKDNSAGKNNIWICITAHTSSGSLPIDTNTDAAKWSLIVDASSATTSAAAAVVSAQLADDYAVKTSGAVTGSDYSSKAWSVGGTGVTTTSSRGAAKEWATTTGGAVDTSEYSAKEYALGTTVAAGSAKDWAVLAEDSAVTGSSYSALHHAAKGAASATAAASSASTASTAATTATNYATKTDGVASGSDHSAKAWAVGGTGITDTSSKGAAKEWASEAEDNTVAGAGTYSALHYSAKASASATAAASSATSAAASSAASSAAGLDYVYSTTTADADPGTGVIRFNHGTLSSATAAYMDDSDANSVDVSTYLLTWDDSTTTSLRGTVKMVKSGTPSTYALYNITGASTDASGYVKLALTHVASNGTFSNSDTVIIHNTRTGNTGSFSEGAVDLNGEKLTLDADADTSIHANVDDQIDIEIAGADDFRFTANTFSVLSGSTLNIDSGATIANSGTATGFADFTAIPDGSVSAPSLANSGDTNTGIYFPAADQVGVTVGGAEKFRFGSNPIPGGTKNLLINGGFNVDQYGGIGNVGDANYEYFIDGWCHYMGYGSAARYSVIKSTAPEGPYSSSSMQLSVNVAETDTSTANMFAGFMQILEGQNIRGLDWGTSGARATTLSFWIRSPVSGTHCVALSDGHGSGRTCPIEYTIDSADVWQYVSVTFPGDTGGTAIPNDETASMWVVFPLHTGSSYEGTAGSWQAGEKYGTSNMVNMVGATSKYVLLTDVQLEIGSVATDFALDDYGTALAKAQRYFYSTNLYEQSTRWGLGAYDATNALGTRQTFPVQMRAAPTTAFTSSAFRSAHNGSIHDSTITLTFVEDQFGYQPYISVQASATQGEWYWIADLSGDASTGPITFDANMP